MNFLVLKFRSEALDFTFRLELYIPFSVVSASKNLYQVVVRFILVVQAIRVRNALRVVISAQLAWITSGDYLVVDILTSCLLLFAAARARRHGYLR